MNFFWKILIVVSGLLVLLAVGFVLFLRSALDSFYGFNHFTYIDKHERYEFTLDHGELDLDDDSLNIIVVDDIEKYIQQYPYIYIVQEHNPIMADWTKDAAGNITYYINDPNTGEEIDFKNLVDIPIYTVLNYVTGEARQYKTLTEVPESDRSVFEQPLTEGCIQKRTCYQK